MTLSCLVEYAEKGIFINSLFEIDRISYKSVRLMKFEKEKVLMDLRIWGVT